MSWKPKNANMWFLNTKDFGKDFRVLSPYPKQNSVNLIADQLTLFLANFIIINILWCHECDETENVDFIDVFSLYLFILNIFWINNYAISS